MSIYDQIIAVCTGHQNLTLTSTQIKNMVSERFGTDRNSVLPPDYCYNRTNEGINFKKHIFIMIEPEKFKYVGENYPYSGQIFSRPRGATVDLVAGEWENGQYHLYDWVEYIDQFLLQEPIELEEPKRRNVTGTVICRSAEVRRKTLERAQGHCEYCGNKGFKMLNNGIYLETHHVISLSDDGPDNNSNVVALCPNHHREAHHGQYRIEIKEILMGKLSGR